LRLRAILILAIIAISASAQTPELRVSLRELTGEAIKNNPSIAAAQKKYTKLDLPASEITRLVKEAMRTLFAGLPGVFALDWMWFPCETKMAIMSMVYGLGFAGLTGSKKLNIKGYPVLMCAARTFDWQTAARNCCMANVSDKRNNFTRMLFSQAFGMQLMFGDMARMRDGDFRPARFGEYRPQVQRVGQYANQTRLPGGFEHVPPQRYFSIFERLQYNR